MMWATRPAIPATHLRRKHGIIWSSGSSSGHGETAKAQMNLPVSVTKTGQLRVSDTMFSRIHCKEHMVLIP